MVLSSSEVFAIHRNLVNLKRHLAEEEKVEKPTQPEIIAIEGDGIVLKNKKKGGVSEVHRLQVYEEIA